uniref:Uncharacterized protein n=1 Tax=Meloidogyne floridensis TaxID=298350 RepID=A0A915NMH9_9BILA
MIGKVYGYGPEFTSNLPLFKLKRDINDLLQQQSPNSSQMFIIPPPSTNNCVTTAQIMVAAAAAATFEQQTFQQQLNNVLNAVSTRHVFNRFGLDFTKETDGEQQQQYLNITPTIFNLPSFYSSNNDLNK